MLTSHSMGIIGEHSADLPIFYSWVLVLGRCFSGEFNGFEHNKSEVEVPEERSSDADLALTDMAFEIIGDVHIGGGSREVSDVDHLVGVLLVGSSKGRSLVHL
jgi:hypothetical protein